MYFIITFLLYCAKHLTSHPHIADYRDCTNFFAEDFKTDARLVDTLNAVPASRIIRRRKLSAQLNLLCSICMLLLRLL